MSESEKDPQPVPQIIEETGVSADYLNELNAFFAISLYKTGRMAADAALSRMFLAVARHGGQLMRRYEFRFAPPIYQQPSVNDKNSGTVSKINLMADEVNAAFQDLVINSKKSDEQKLADFGAVAEPYLEKFKKIIYGK